MTFKGAVIFAILMLMPVLAFAAERESLSERTGLSKHALSSEDALEQRFNIDVQQTLQDRGGDTYFQRDRIGTGAVGVFYDHTYNNRIQDGSDAIGVQFRLLKL